MLQQTWKFPLFTLLVGSLASLGQSAHAESNAHLLAQVVQPCEYDGFPDYYSRITTNDGDSLRVRATPDGRVIGDIPDGWAVVVLEWSRNGAWARVTSHFGNMGNMGFGSAPRFREGWVSAAYLKDIGRSCNKPDSVGQLLQPQLFGERPVEVQTDWLALGDALAEML